MKKLSWILPVLLAASAVGMAGCSKTGQQPTQSQQQDSSPAKVTQYTCTMHPEVVQNSPGKCPKCGMELVEKR